MNEQQPWYVGDDPWRLTQHGFDPARNIYFETIFAQANGYMGVRGYTETPLAQADTVREGYLAGVFSDVDEQAAAIIGRFPWPVMQMVSLPELFGCTIDLDGERLSLETGVCLAYQRSLDLRTAVLETRLAWRSPDGRTTELGFERFCDAANPHLAHQRITATPRDWSGPLRVGFALDGQTPSLFRCGDRKQPHLPQYHFHDHATARADDRTGVLAMTTRHTGHRIAIASRLATPADCDVDASRDDRLVQTLETPAAENQALTLSRTLAVTCSRDDEVTGDPAEAAVGLVGDPASGYDAALDRQRRVWAERWDRADIAIDGPALDQKVVRYNMFQLLQMAPYHTDRLSLPARALAWNRYRGMYFWDTEIFLLPFYIWAEPRVARNLLGFRWHTLDGARDNAWHWGGRGALYPWMGDADTGRDNAIDARVWKLFHQTADIAYAVDAYARASGDAAFMLERGLEVLLETARFFASRLVRHEGDAWHLERTIGPDEDHGPGLDNGFTMLMARRNLRLALGWLDHLADRQADRIAALRDRLGLEDREVDRWRDMAEHIHVPMIEGRDIPLQDEYLLTKKPADVAGWHLRDEPTAWSLDPATLGQYQVIKQADVILAMFLLADEFTDEQLAAAFDFYEPMTLHISSLSWNTHAIVAARLGRRKQAYDYYLKSAGLDLDDVKHATDDGLHAAALGGCWQAVVLGFAGLAIRQGKLTCDPQLPEPWRSVRFKAHHRGTWHTVEVHADGRWRAEAMRDER